MAPVLTTSVTLVALSNDTGASASDFITSSNFQTIAGTLSANLSPGEYVEISYDGGASWTTATSAVGSNTWSISATLAGSNTLMARVTDVNLDSGPTFSQAYVIDQTAPAAPSTPDLRSADDTGSANNDNLTSVTTPVFTGTAESGSTVTLYDSDGTTVLGVTTAIGGSWTITSSALSTGSHNLTVKATDAAGNVSAASAGTLVTIDTTAPTLAVTSNVPTLKAGETATITFTFSEDPGATFTWNGSSGDVTVSGGTLSAISGSGLTRTASFTPAASTNSGTASITVASGSYADIAGNLGAAGTSPTLSFDTLAPLAPSKPVGDATTTVRTPTFTGTAEAGSTVTLYDTDGTTVLGTAVATGGAWSITASSLALGNHSISAKATDAAGNVSPVSAVLGVAIEAPPSPPVSDPPTLPTQPVLPVVPDPTPGDGFNEAQAGVIVTTFLTGQAPTAEKAASLAAFSQVQFAYYSQIGVANPALGSFEAIGRGFAETSEFNTKYGALSEAAFISSVYQSVFSRAGTAAQIEHFQAQIDYFEAIYESAGISSEQADLYAKGAVLGQMLGHVSLSTAGSTLAALSFLELL